MNRVEFKGIVRCTSPQNNADGNCEEVVNLRLDEGAWRLVGGKKTIVDTADYEQVYVHKYGTFENFIGLKEGKVRWFASLEEGEVVEKNQDICSVSGQAKFAQVNNILLVKDDTNISKTIFKENRYASTVVKLPDTPRLEVKVRVKPQKTDEIPLAFNRSSQTEREAFQAALYGLVKECEKDGLNEGRVLLCATYQLFDGSETKPTPPLLVNLGRYEKSAIQMKDIGWHTAHNPRERNSGTFWAEIPLGELNVKIADTWGEEFRDVVTKVNVYATAPRSFYDSEQVVYGYAGVIDVDGKFATMIPERKLTEADLETALFYKVASFDLQEMNGTYRVIDFKAVTTNRTMGVDASGWMDTTGEMFVYNNRLHLFDIHRRFVEDAHLGYCLEERHQIMDIGVSGEVAYNYDFATNRTLTAVFYLKMEQGDMRVVEDFRVEQQSSGLDASSGKMKYKVRLPRFWAFPDSRAYRADLYDGLTFVKTVYLKPSLAYNYSFVLFGVTTSGLANRPTIVDDSIVEYLDSPVSVDLSASLAFEDNMTLLVSEAMNPYYFPPSHSYLMPGEIVNLAVNTEQISASQVGQYPLYVFTTEGIYALQVGDGKVLYSNVVPVSAEVAVPGGAVLQTKYGVVFVTAKGLKVISGTQVADFSKPLDGGLDLALRKSRHYPQVMRNARMGADFGAMASVVPFREYSRGAVMGYDISEDEVIVSNPAYGYSYVFGLETKAWHKITDVFVGISRHLGLQEYLAAPKGARARVDIVSTIQDGFVQQYDWSVEIPHMELYAGSVLILVGSQILVSFTTAQPLTLEQALGRMQAPWNVAYYDSGTKTLYLSTKSDRMNLRASGIPPRTFLFSKNSAEIPVPPKGHGQNISLMLAGREFSYTTKPTDTAASIAKEMAALAKGIGFGVETDEGGLFVEALPGAAGNDLPPILCKSSPNVSLKATPFSGGKDACWKKRVCDLREEDEGIRPVYLQTRPMHLGSEGYKKIRHLAMEGEFKPDPSKYYGIFVYASDNLSDWTLVGEGAFNRNGSRLTLPMVDKSYRYFTVAIGGVVCSGHVLSFLDLACEAKLNNRLR